MIAATESGSEAKLLLLTETANPSDNQINIETNDNGQTYLLSVTFDPNAARSYWAMPKELTSNLLDLYGSTVKVVVKTILVDGAQPSTSLQALMITSDGQRLTSSVGPITDGFVSELVLSLRESAWLLVGGSESLSHSDFLKALAKVTQVLVPATLSSGEHTSRYALLFGIFFY